VVIELAKLVMEKVRVCFRWEGGDAYNVEIVDYH